MSYCSLGLPQMLNVMIATTTGTAPTNGQIENDRVLFWRSNRIIGVDLVSSLLATAYIEVELRRVASVVSTARHNAKSRLVPTNSGRCPATPQQSGSACLSSSPEALPTHEPEEGGSGFLTLP